MSGLGSTVGGRGLCAQAREAMGMCQGQHILEQRGEAFSVSPTTDGCPKVEAWTFSAGHQLCRSRGKTLSREFAWMRGT
jgi:hypothetical protein